MRRLLLTGKTKKLRWTHADLAIVGTSCELSKISSSKKKSLSSFVLKRVTLHVTETFLFNQNDVKPLALNTRRALYSSIQRQIALEYEESQIVVKRFIQESDQTDKLQDFLQIFPIPLYIAQFTELFLFALHCIEWKYFLRASLKHISVR